MKNITIQFASLISTFLPYEKSKNITSFLKKVILACHLAWQALDPMNLGGKDFPLLVLFFPVKFSPFVSHSTYSPTFEKCLSLRFWFLRTKGLWAFWHLGLWALGSLGHLDLWVLGPLGTWAFGQLGL